MSLTSRKAGHGKLAHAITIGTHVLTADEPVESGGDDLGPTPHDLFDAALAACTSITVTMYAQRKAWPLEDVQVEIIRDDREERSGTYRLSRRITLIGALDAEQRARLMDIAGKCPIHKLMQSHIVVTTVAAD